MMEQYGYFQVAGAHHDPKRIVELEQRLASMEEKHQQHHVQIEGMLRNEATPPIVREIVRSVARDELSKPTALPSRSHSRVLQVLRVGSECALWGVVLWLLWHMGGL
jgi:hypothetical protein